MTHQGLLQAAVAVEELGLAEAESARRRPPSRAGGQRQGLGLGLGLTAEAQGREQEGAAEEEEAQAQARGLQLLRYLDRYADRFFQVRFQTDRQCMQTAVSAGPVHSSSLFFPLLPSSLWAALLEAC